MNIRKFALIAACLSIGALSQAAERERTAQSVRLPSAEVLKKRLDKEGFQYFVEKTKVDKKLAKRDLTPEGLALAVQLAVADYIKREPDFRVGMAIQMMVPDVTNTIVEMSKEPTK